MAIKVTCPECWKEFSAQDAYHFKTISCPNCRKKVQVVTPGEAKVIAAQEKKTGQFKIPRKWLIAAGAAGAGIVILIIWLVFFTSAPQQEKTVFPSPKKETIAEWSYCLEKLGWVFEKDSFGNLESPMPTGVRFVTYKIEDNAKGIYLSCEIMTIDAKIWTLCIIAYNILTVTQVNCAMDKMLLTFGTLVPSSVEPIAFAIRNMSERGGDKNGLKRLQGSATTEDGWRITTIEYLEHFKAAKKKPSLYFLAQRIEK